jgi:hypothetical protein
MSPGTVKHIEQSLEQSCDPIYKQLVDERWKAPTMEQLRALGAIPTAPVYPAYSQNGHFTAPPAPFMGTKFSEHSPLALQMPSVRPAHVERNTAPYLQGYAPPGLSMDEAAASRQLMYLRPLTEEEKSARLLYWGGKQQKEKGLPKFDGKDFFPPSPVKQFSEASTVVRKVGGSSLDSIEEVSTTEAGTTTPTENGAAEHDVFTSTPGTHDVKTPVTAVAVLADNDDTASVNSWGAPNVISTPSVLSPSSPAKCVLSSTHFRTFYMTYANVSNLQIEENCRLAIPHGPSLPHKFQRIPRPLRRLKHTSTRPVTRICGNGYPFSVHTQQQRAGRKRVADRGRQPREVQRPPQNTETGQCDWWDGTDAYYW